MGIPGLYAWLQKNCPALIQALDKSIPIDNLCLDLNGIIHLACQKVFKYGEFKPKFDIKRDIPLKVLEKRAHHEVGNIIDNIVSRVNPKRRVLIMIDGVAGMAKQSQQRQRRYRAAMEKDRVFDSNCISPGTDFMDHLSNYLDHFIREKVTSIWRHLEVVFSSEKVPGEGEHKLIRYIRKYGRPEESWVLYGLDADLVMLGLSIQNRMDVIPRFYILREDAKGNSSFMDLSILRMYIIQELNWDLIDCCDKRLIIDFIYICFLLGNDFLPHSPTLDLINGGIEEIMSVYSITGRKLQQHLINKDLSINKLFFTHMLSLLAESEEDRINAEINSSSQKFADDILMKYTTKQDNGLLTVDFDAYRNEYYRSHFRVEIEKVCHDFFHGMEWVIQYYINGIPSWDWHYPYHFAPFATEMCQAVCTYMPKNFNRDNPMPPLLQLMTILPPQSSSLLPPEIASVVTSDPEQYPLEVKVDLSGKRFDWQGIVCVPFIDKTRAMCTYSRLTINPKDARKNKQHFEVVYRFDTNVFVEFKSYTGKFMSRCSTMVLR